MIFSSHQQNEEASSSHSPPENMESQKELPLEVVSRILRDVALARMYQSTHRRELNEAASYIHPVFAAWSRVAYYESNFPGSTDCPRSVAFEP